MYEMAVKIFSLYLYVIMVNCAITAHVEIIQNTGKVMLFFLFTLSLFLALHLLDRNSYEKEDPITVRWVPVSHRQV